MGTKMTPRFNFAPVSSAQSSLLRLASGYFLLNGIVYGLLVAIVVLGHLFGQEVFAPTILSVLGILVPATTAVGLVWTGSLLGRGSRLGGLLALGFVLLPTAFGIVSRTPIGVTDLVFGVLGVTVLSLIWRELR
jgi:hypothetical protein